MKLFTIYKTTTGDIIRDGIVNLDSDVYLQANAGESLLVGVRGDQATQKVDITASPPVLIAR